jgi:hypothetical protein
MFELVSTMEALSGMSTLIIAASVALGGTVAMMIWRAPLRNRLRRRRPAQASRIQPDAMLIEPLASATRPADEMAASFLSPPGLAEPEGELATMRTILCPPELSRRIDRLELKIRTRSATRSG